MKWSESCQDVLLLCVDRLDTTCSGKVLGETYRVWVAHLHSKCGNRRVLVWSHQFVTSWH